MIIHRQAVKIKHPDYYRKKYWDNNLARRKSFSKNWQNEVGQTYFDSPEVNFDTSLVWTKDSIKPHTDFPATSWLLILHNYCYQFQYERDLYDINPGDVLEFDLMVEHGIAKTKPGRNLFLAITVDETQEITSNIEYIKSMYSPYI